MQIKDSEWRGMLDALDDTTKTMVALQEKHDLTAAELKERIEELEADRQASSGSQVTNAEKRRQQEELKGFEYYVRTGDRRHVEKADTKAIDMGSAAAGGALVPEQIANQIVSRAMERSDLVNIVRNSGPFTSDYVRLLNRRGTAAAWSAETGSRTETATPLFREVRPTHGELYSYPKFTRHAAQDAQFNVQTFLVQNVGDEFSKSLENSVLRGDGSSKPTGILNTASVTTDDDASPQRSADAIEFIAGTADLANDLISLYFSLKSDYRKNGKWLMTSATLAAIRKLRDSNGSGFLWQSTLSDGVDASNGGLLNRPIVLSEYMGLLGASPLDDAVLFGDFDVGYELVRIGGMFMVRDEITTPGYIKLYTGQRWGGRLVDNNAIKSLHA